MSRTTLNHISLVLVLAAVLSLVPQSSWAGSSRHPKSPATPARPAVAASVFAQGWSHLVRIWARVGSAIDPNGIWSPTGNSGTSGTITDPRNLN